MTDWYESAVASHLLMAMGYRNGVHRREVGASVLLNQNPLEAVFADAAGAQDGRFFLAEFKRDRSSIGTERRKALRRSWLALLEEAEVLHEEFSRSRVGRLGGLKYRTMAADAGGESRAAPLRLLYDQSRRGHWLAWAAPDEEPLQLRFQPYVLLLGAHQKLRTFDGAPAFLDAFSVDNAPAETAGSPLDLVGWTYQEFCDYTARMAALDVLDGSGESGESGENADPDEGAEPDEAPGVVVYGSSAGLVGLPFNGTQELITMLQSAEPTRSYISESWTQRHRLVREHSRLLLDTSLRSRTRTSSLQRAVGKPSTEPSAVWQGYARCRLQLPVPPTCMDAGVAIPDLRKRSPRRFPRISTLDVPDPAAHTGSCESVRFNGTRMGLWKPARSTHCESGSAVLCGATSASGACTQYA